jgi:type I restriction enzyme S subunit
MKSNFKPLGQFITIINKQNKDKAIDLLLGMNIKKEFIPSIANTSNSDLSKYKIIEKYQFAYSPMQTGRDETIRISLYTDNTPAIISPAYSVFKVINTSILLPEFLMIYFLRSESDRYGWFISDGSVRASLDWDRFCEIEIPVPNLNEQKKYVDLYKSLLNNQQCYENSLSSLRFICNAFLYNQISKGKKQRLGEYINVINNKNHIKCNKIMGINIKKQFILSISNTTNTDLSKYKLIYKNQFAYSPMQVGRDKAIRVAFYTDEEPAIISPAYSIFEVKDPNILSPLFLMSCFHHPDFDHYGWFISDGSVRSSVDLKQFLKIPIHIPNIEKQKAIVAIHHVLEKRKEINEKLKSLVKPLCPVLVKGVLNYIKVSKV